MGHISDRTLDSLLDGSLNDEGELAIEEHVRRCDRCAHRLREWELLFPQIKSLIPTGEHQIPNALRAAVPPTARPDPPSVYVPDWTPPPTRRTLPVRLAWGVVVILAIGAGYLLFQRTQEEPETAMEYQPNDSYETATRPNPPDSTAGLGSGIATPSIAPSDSAATARDTIAVRRESTPQSTRIDSAPTPTKVVSAPTPAPKRQEPPPQPVARRETPEQDVRPAATEQPPPASAAIKTEPVDKPLLGVRTELPPAQSAVDSQPPLPLDFQRATLEEARQRLGSVRLIQGLTPEVVEIAQGSALPGADPALAVVRLVYDAPEGRLILDQQRLGRAGSREPNIAISTTPTGVSVAQWVDRGGFWITLAGKADQQTLLAVANRVR